MNLPNILATLRIVLAPLLFFLLINTEPIAAMGVHPSWVHYFAALIFGVAALTDFFDGFIARAWGQKTNLGAIIDPLADKMLILAAFLGLLIRDSGLLRTSSEAGTYYVIELWAIYIILVREFFITGFRVVMLKSGLEVAASFAGKLKTAFQMVAIIFLIMQWSWGVRIDQLLLYVALVLTIYSGIEYILFYKRRTKRG